MLSLLEKRVLCLNTTATVRPDRDPGAAAGGPSPEKRKYTTDPRTQLPIVPPNDSLKTKFPSTLEGGIIHYMDECHKLNGQGKQQQRVLIISSNVLYLCMPDNGSVRRCVPLTAITHVRVHSESQQVALTIPSEYDALLRVKDAAKIAHILEATTAFLNGHAAEASQGPIDRAGLQLEGGKKKENIRIQPLSVMEEITDWENTEGQLGDRSRRIAELEQALAAATAELEELRRRQDELEGRLADAAGRLAAAAEQADRDAGTIRDLTEAAARREAEAAQLAQHAEALAHELEELRLAVADGAAFREESARLQRERDALAQLHAEAQAQLADALAEGVAAVQRAADAERQAAEAAEREVRRQAEEQRLVDQVALLEAASARWEEVNAGLLSANCGMGEQIARDAKELTELREAAARLVGVTAELAAAKEANEALAELGRAHEELVAEAQLLGAELGEAEQRGRAHRARVEELELEVRELRAELLGQVCAICKQQKVVTHVGGGFLRFNEFVQKYGLEEAARLQEVCWAERLRQLRDWQAATEAAASPTATALQSPRGTGTGGGPALASPPREPQPTLFRQQGNRIAVKLAAGR